MGKWTLGKKILLGGTFFGALTVLQGFISLSTMYRARQAVNALNHDTFATLYLAGKMKGVAKDQRIAIIFDINRPAKRILRSMRPWGQSRRGLAPDSRRLSEVRSQDAMRLPSLRSIKPGSTRCGPRSTASRAGDKQRAWSITTPNSSRRPWRGARSRTLWRRSTTNAARTLLKPRSTTSTAASRGRWRPADRGCPGAALSVWFSRLIDRSMKPLEDAIQALGKGCCAAASVPSATTTSAPWRPI